MVRAEARRLAHGLTILPSPYLRGTIRKGEGATPLDDTIAVLAFKKGAIEESVDASAVTLPIGVPDEGRNQSSSEALRRNQTNLEDMQSDAIRGNQAQSDAIRNAVRGNQGPLEASRRTGPGTYTRRRSSTSHTRASRLTATRPRRLSQLPIGMCRSPVVHEMQCSWHSDGTRAAAPALRRQLHK